MGELFGKHLKSWRKAAKMTQEDIAEKLHLNRSAVSKIENDLQEISIPLFRRWAAVTNCDVQAALILFGAEICARAGQLTELIPAFSNLMVATQLY